MKKWSEVAGSPAFQSLSPEEREAARRQYFDSVVAPRVAPEELGAAWSAFDADTAAAASAPQGRNAFAVVNDNVIEAGNAVLLKPSEHTARCGALPSRSAEAEGRRGRLRASGYRPSFWPEPCSPPSGG